MFQTNSPKHLFCILCLNFSCCAKTVDVLFVFCDIQFNCDKEVINLIEAISEKITGFLVDSNEISGDINEFRCYKYGIEIALSSILNIVLILSIGTVTGRFIESVIFLAVFIPIRQFSGGYHADTYFRCNMFFCISFVMVLLLFEILKVFNSVYLLLAIDLFSLSIIAFFSPIENRNKPIPVEKRMGLKLKATLISALISLVSLIMHCYWVVYGSLLSCTLLMISVLIISGKIKERRKRNYES